MRNMLFFAMTMFLIISSQGFIACNGGGKEKSQTSSTRESLPADLSWNDVPIYPKAIALKRDSKMVNAMIKKSHTERGEMRFWETNESSDSVISFFETELPRQGWEKIMGMKMGPDSYIMTWHKKVKGEDKGITVDVADSRAEGKVRFSIIMGQGDK